MNLNKSEFRLNLLSLIISFLAMLTAVGSLLFIILKHEQQERITLAVSCQYLAGLPKVRFEDSYYYPDFEKDLVFIIGCQTTNSSSKKVGIERIFVDMEIKKKENFYIAYSGNTPPIFSKGNLSLPLLLDIGEPVRFKLLVRWPFNQKEAKIAAKNCPNFVKGQSNLMDAYCCLKKHGVDLNESNTIEEFKINIHVAGRDFGRKKNFPEFSTTLNFQHFYCSSV